MIYDENVEVEQYLKLVFLRLHNLADIDEIKFKVIFFTCPNLIHRKINFLRIHDFIGYE